MRENPLERDRNRWSRRDWCGLQHCQMRRGTRRWGRMLTDDLVFVRNHHTIDWIKPSYFVSRLIWIQQKVLISATLVQSPGNYGDLTWENAWCAFHSTDADTASCTFFLTLSWTGEGGSKLKLFSSPGADEARMIQASVFKGGSGGFKHVCCSRSYVIVMDPGITSWSLYGVRYPRTWTSVNTKIKKASQTQKDEGRHRQLIPE